MPKLLTADGYQLLLHRVRETLVDGQRRIDAQRGRINRIENEMGSYYFMQKKTGVTLLPYFLRSSQLPEQIPNTNIHKPQGWRFLKKTFL